MKYGCLPLISLLFLQSLASAETYQATGVKVGEVSDTSAIIWVRLTANSERRSDGLIPSLRPGERRPEPIPADVKIEDLEGSCPGSTGKIGLRYAVIGEWDPFQEGHSIREITWDTTWAVISALNDYTHQFRLNDLRPNNTYIYYVESALDVETEDHGLTIGYFRTAPSKEESKQVTFTVITGQAYNDKDRPDGFHIYESMAKLKPNFIIPTGDTVYYDNDPPLANTIEAARYHWNRMYSLPTLRDFHLRVPGYWIKDDHDTLSNDCWPTMAPEFMLPLTFEDGQRIFREQVPMGEKTYRTYRWGKHLQVWIPEGRDFRSPNDAPDGPGKTIWGEEQKKWLFESVRASDADWKILASATPIVGPDRGNKADNHANEAFAWEGNQVRRWIAENCPDNLIIVCGDRHWQYESIHPETKVQEFSCGPASNEHAGGIPEDSSAEYKWFRVEGGFLSVSVTPQEKGSQIAFRHHDVKGNVVHEFSKETPSP